ncbi:ABC transporter ATP-binding protein [Verrucomicrobiota bacterium]
MYKNALELKGIVKKYRKRIALNGLDLNVPSGNVLGLVGSNGAGKTTTLSVISGLLKIHSGTINLFEEGPFDPVKHSGRLTMMPQDSDLPKETNVKDILMFYAQLQGLNITQAKETVTEAIKWVNLSDRADSTIRTLSHGMRRRVVIAQAFLGSPELVLLDEPLSGLDPKEVANIRNMLSQKKGHQTIMISSHNLYEIEKICDSVVFIELGKNMRQDSMDTITGRSHMLVYWFSGPDLPLTQLREQLPDVIFEIDKDAKVLTCRCMEKKKAIHDVNKTILKNLLDADVEILQMRQGSELESVYLNNVK